MAGDFHIETVGDFSGIGCQKYINLSFPFSKVMEIGKDGQIHEKEYFQEHIALGNKFTNTQKKINKCIDDYKISLEIVNKEIKKYLEDKKGYTKPNEKLAFTYTNPSIEIENDFKGIIEFCAARLQDVARLCLKITGQGKESLSKSNLVKEYEGLLKNHFANNQDVIKALNDDSNWITILKELRNEAIWHEGGDSNGRELIFYPMKISFGKEENDKVKIQLPTFRFKHKKGVLVIDDFASFFDVLMSNIYNLSIDWLVFAYSYKTKFPIGVVYQLIKISRIK